MNQIGSVEVLNCGAGHLTFSFNSDDAMEVERARRVVTDMLRRGYALFVESKGKTHKVKKFDEKTDAYLIADGPLYPGESDQRDNDEPTPKRPPLRAIPARRTKATGVAPSSGG